MIEVSVWLLWDLRWSSPYLLEQIAEGKTVHLVAENQKKPEQSPTILFRDTPLLLTYDLTSHQAPPLKDCIHSHTTKVFLDLSCKQALFKVLYLSVSIHVSLKLTLSLDLSKIEIYL